MMNPFEQKPMPMEKLLMNWNTLYPTPYDKRTADPYTKIRIILMNGIEVEATMFSHQFHRHCPDNNLRRELALMRRMEQQQQKHVNWLKPVDETQLETTIGFEHIAVDLTAWMAQNEPDPTVKAQLDFALLEDFDHLYRYANLLDMDYNIPSHTLTKRYVDITPGRPTLAEHRNPADAPRTPVDFKKANIQTKLNTLIITAGEQQTMNFYMNIGNTYTNDLGRKLYQEIAMIEEQHVSEYGSLIDPNLTWLESLLLLEYMECYLYYSFYEDELDANVKGVWELHLQQELAHLHKAAELLRRHEGKDWRALVPGTFPKPLQFHDTRDYVRKVLAEQVELTADKEQMVCVHDIAQDHGFFCYQEQVGCNDVESVASHIVICEHKKAKGLDYRDESMPCPVAALADRAKDDTEIARTK